MDAFELMVVRRYSDSVEWERLAGEQWQPLRPGPGALEFNLLSLAAAAARMQLTHLTPRIMQAPPETHLETFQRHTCRMFEDLQMLVVADRGDGMTLVAPPAHWLMDFERTTLAGRIGAGFSMLVMCALGYWYVGPYEVVMAMPDTRSRAPDFVFENGAAERALVEAKGSFSLRARIRETARKALRRQVAPALSTSGAHWGCAIAAGVSTRHDGRPGIALCDLGSPLPAVSPTREVETSSGPIDPFLHWSVTSPTMFRAHWAATLAFCGFPASARAMWRGEAMSPQALANDGLGDQSRREDGAVLGNASLLLGSDLGKLECGLEPDVASGLGAMLVDAQVMRYLGRYHSGPKIRGPEADQSEPQFVRFGMTDLDDDRAHIRFPDGVVCILKRIERDEAASQRGEPSHESGHGQLSPVEWGETTVVGIPSLVAASSTSERSV